MINFVSSGKLGDFIHSLYVVKNICERDNEKSNLFLNEGGDVWALGIDKAFKDLYPIIIKQEYINEFNIIEPESRYFIDGHIDLNSWREEAATTHAETGRYNKSWSELLSGCYGFEIPKEYKWLDATAEDKNTVGKTVIHRSLRHHFKGADFWNSITDKNDVLFATTDIKEWEGFQFKGKAEPYILVTLTEWVNAIGSCEYFIGNQSAGFAIASALDIPRSVELYPDVAIFYKNETKYSKNITCIL